MIVVAFTDWMVHPQELTFGKLVNGNAETEVKRVPFLFEVAVLNQRKPKIRT